MFYVVFGDGEFFNGFRYNAGKLLLAVSKTQLMLLNANGVEVFIEDMKAIGETNFEVKQFPQ